MLISYRKSKMSLSGSGELFLRQLDSNEVKELLDLYKEKYGKKHFHYLLLYNQCKWNKNLEELGVEETDTKWNGLRKKFYTHPNCDFRKYGTYISLHYDLMQSVSFNSWEPELNELYECLQNTSLIDWQSGPLLTNVSLEYCERVKEIATSKGAAVQKARLCCGYVMPRGKALQLDIPSLPSDYEMRELQVENADLIHDVWPNKKEGSLNYIRSLIHVNKSLGIFRKTDNALVSWIIQNDFAGIGFLETLPEVQRKGLGRILTVALSKCIAESEDVELSAWIRAENYKSKSLFEKVGYENSVLNEWIQLEKKCYIN